MSLIIPPNSPMLKGIEDAAKKITALNYEKSIEEKIEEVNSAINNLSPQSTESQVLAAIEKSLLLKDSILRSQHKKQIQKNVQLTKKEVDDMYKSMSEYLFEKAPKKAKDNVDYDSALEQQAEINLKSPDLILKIHSELNKHHIQDHKEKVGLFIIRLSAELPNPQDHVSAALKGASSAGKDNAIKSVLNLFPEQDNLFLTRATQSALEERASTIKCVAFSEINANREEGANGSLTEVFKQFSEGGVSVLKRDKLTNEIVEIKTAQKTLLYGTTESKSDEELETRYVIIPISSNENKNLTVVNDYLSSISDPEKYKILLNKNNWVQAAISRLDHSLDVIVPYAPLLNNPFKNQEGKEERLFDMKKERVKRDVKRLLSLTKAISWLYQKQRLIKEFEGVSYIVSEPQDFKLAFFLLIDFFDLTYSGIDFRIVNVFKKIGELEGSQSNEILSAGYGIQYSDWVFRHKLHEQCDWISSVNTLKNHLLELKDKGLIETYWDASLPKGYLIKAKGGYQLGYQQGVRGCQLIACDTLLTPYLIGLKPDNSSENSKEMEEYESVCAHFKEFEKISTSFLEHLTPINLTPINSPADKQNNLSHDDVLMILKEHPDGLSVARLVELGFSEDQVSQWKSQGVIFEPRAGFVRLL